MTKVGETQDGKDVLSGVFPMEDTEGIPLPIVLGFLNDRGFMPSWLDYYHEARCHGWKHKTIIRKLSESVEEIYGSDFRDVVIERLTNYGEGTYD